MNPDSYLDDYALCRRGWLDPRELYVRPVRILDPQTGEVVREEQPDRCECVGRHVAGCPRGFGGPGIVSREQHAARTRWQRAQPQEAA